MHRKFISAFDAGGTKAFSSLLILFLCFAFPVIIANTVNAQEDTQSSVPDSFCLNCHGTMGMTTELPSGEPLPLGVDKDYFHNSIHGLAGIGCADCHTDHREFPHPPLPEGLSHREYTILSAKTCDQCHQDVAELIKGNAHERAMGQGHLEAAVCTDCHGSHDTQSFKDKRILSSQTCEHCHSEIFDLYTQSVHGEALIGEGNPDVPACVDCHHAHAIDGPNNPEFHLFSPEICARCHTDEALMAKYGLNTNVLDTWVYDFHGKTVELYQETTPEKQVDKAVCVDCHSVHDIRATDDPNSTVMKENLLQTCKKCHPAATANFPDSWMGHYSPNIHKYPLVFFVTWFYRLLIFGVIGGMLLFVVTDYIRQIIDHKRGKV